MRYIIVLFLKNKKRMRNRYITKDDIKNNIKGEIINGNLDELINKLHNNEKEDLIIESNDLKYFILVQYSVLRRIQQLFVTLADDSKDNILKKTKQTLKIGKLNFIKANFFLWLIQRKQIRYD